MSIASKLQLLQQDITNARTAITEKGGTVTQGGGSSQLATDIATIPSGGNPRLKNISPITSNGKYAVTTDVILVDGLTTTGNGYFITDIILDAGVVYDIEFECDTTNYPYSYSSSLFGAKHITNGTNAFRLSTNASAINYYGYTNGKVANANALTKQQVLHIKTDFNNSKFYINNVQYSTSNGSSTSGTSYPLYILAENYGSGTKSDNFKGGFNYLKIFDTNGTLLYWFVPARNSNNDALLYDRVNAVKYSATGSGFTLGADVSDESYDGFASPIQVNVPAPTKWGATLDDMFNTSVSSTPTLHNVVIPAGEANISLQRVFQYSTIKSFTATGPFISTAYYAYYYAIANNPYLESINIQLGSSWSSTNNGWQYFAYQCTGLKHASINGLFGSAANAFNQMFGGCTALEEVIWYFNPSQPYFQYTNQFNNTFNGCANLIKITFSGLQRSNGNATNVFNLTFRDCFASYDNDINHFRFPDLHTIGNNSGTTNYGNFRYTWNTTNSSSYGKVSLILPELLYIYNRNTTATYGHFAYNNGLGAIYLPKFIADGTTGQNIFNNCPYLTEIHFGMENQTTVEALAGYASKFGATNATIYFDMVNHITYNGINYLRCDQGNYDYDNNYYSWQNPNVPTQFIYTTNAINPAVGDTVYSKSDSTYTAVGTITAVS